MGLVAGAALCVGCGGGGGGDGGGGGGGGTFEGQVGTILFVTQVPVSGNDGVTASFSNHQSSVAAAPRGGDLMIRYPDGTLRNLTREAGFGDAGDMQGKSAIAVRQPCVHWSGNRALFSMVVGSVTERFDQSQTFHWQIYEVTGLGRDDTASVRKIDGQPADFNNINPVYGSDDSILFVSDRPASGAAHLYPQLDEYESQPSTTGIYRLDEQAGDLEMIESAPSGVFSISVDTYGRLVFTKWDHLQRDQQADSLAQAQENGAVTFADESAAAATTSSILGAEVYPEPRNQNDPAYDPAVSGHRFNHFFLWEVNQDGTAEETLNHIGRQEWGGTYTDGSFVDDPNLSYESKHVHRNTDYQLPNDGGTFQIRQDPTDPDWYYATVSREFGTGNAGTLIHFQGGEGDNPEDMQLEPVTPTVREANVPEDTGYFRNPLPMSDGTLIAVHTSATDDLANLGSSSAPSYAYEFRLTALEPDGARMKAGGRLTEGIQRTVKWYTPDELASWSGTLWELDPVEVIPRDPPAARQEILPDVEQAVFDDVGVDPAQLSMWLRQRELALIITRNTTQRDRNDVQQPYNLEVPGGVSSIATDGKVYQVDHLQFFEGDQLRSYQRFSSGRRVLARPMHGPDLVTDPQGPPGSVALGLDGSMAAFVPARRALSWQLTAPDGSAVVRERNWVSFRAGEIRVCSACHGVNKFTQTGDPPPDNTPAALRALLLDWQASQ